VALEPYLDPSVSSLVRDLNGEEEEEGDEGDEGDDGALVEPHERGELVLHLLEDLAQ
jgi:hypothetical protein